MVFAWVKDIKAAAQFQSMVGMNQKRYETLIRWDPPPLEWVKVNTDGVARSSVSQARSGGLIRDNNGT